MFDKYSMENHSFWLISFQEICLTMSWKYSETFWRRRQCFQKTSIWYSLLRNFLNCHLSLCFVSQPWIKPLILLVQRLYSLNQHSRQSWSPATIQSSSPSDCRMPSAIFVFAFIAIAWTALCLLLYISILNLSGMLNTSSLRLNWQFFHNPVQPPLLPNTQ